MTGFGRTEGASGGWSWAVEARSVNGRGLDVRFRGPSGFDRLEARAREAAQARFQRGQVAINVQAQRLSPARQPRVNLANLDRYLAIAETFVLAGRASSPSMDGLLALPGVVELVDLEDDQAEHAGVESAIALSIDAAVVALAQSRRAEGAGIGLVLEGFLQRIAHLVEAATVDAALQPELLKLRYERRLAELVGDGVDRDRIVQEAAAMALKADVREEIDRLVGHVASAKSLIGGEAASGRRLDFLTQEFMREANTLCSKSASASLTASGLELKAVIDQFREQVQNVE
jgi:uncharacterized protein (TIGR00255 family)